MEEERQMTRGYSSSESGRRGAAVVEGTAMTLAGMRTMMATGTMTTMSSRDNTDSKERTAARLLLLLLPRAWMPWEGQRFQAGLPGRWLPSFASTRASVTRLLD